MDLPPINPVRGFYKNTLLFICLTLLVFSHLKASAETNFQHLQSLKYSSLLVETGPHSLRPDQPMVPASTVKVLTALLALQNLGPEYRFNTDFYLDQKNVLWIKAYGDPFLISEELDQMVNELIKKLDTYGLQKDSPLRLNGIGIDDSFFSQTIAIDGQSRTDNPYDATASALAANFNTLNILINSQGEVRSAEKQTPTTPMMHELARQRSLGTGKHRISLHTQSESSRYFAELLTAKLRLQGLKITDRVIRKRVPENIDLFYRHLNNHNLASIISAMLQYSNNFIANQLFLLSGIAKSGPPATMEKSRQYFQQQISRQFGWRDYQIVEGAGLSRSNRLSARQLIEVLQRFRPYKDLLAIQNPHIYAKSGTLKGVSTYAGYLKSKQKWLAFALMINEPVAYDFRKRLAESLLIEYNR